MTALKDSTYSYGELLAASSTFVQLLVGKLVRLGVAAVWAGAILVLFAPQLGFQKGSTYFVIGKLLLYGEDIHTYSVLPLLWVCQVYKCLFIYEEREKKKKEQTGVEQV